MPCAGLKNERLGERKSYDGWKPFTIRETELTNWKVDTFSEDKVAHMRAIGTVVALAVHLRGVDDTRAGAGSKAPAKVRQNRPERWPR